MHYEIGKAIAAGETYPEVVLDFYNNNREARVDFLQGLFDDNSQVVLDKEEAETIRKFLDREKLAYSYGVMNDGKVHLILIGEL